MCRFLLSAIAALTFAVTTAHAQLLDQMLSEQVATTTAGKTTDITRIKAPQEEKLWNSRVFKAQLQGVCAVEQPSSVSLVTTEPGRTQVAIKNAKGEVSITWHFDTGIPASELPFSGVELSLLNQIPKSHLTVSMSAALNTSAIPLLSTRKGIQVPSTLSPQGKTLSVSFLDLAPRVFKVPTIVVNSLTITLSVEGGCDALYSLQSVRLIPRANFASTTPKRSTRVDTVEATPTIESTQILPLDPCMEDERIPYKIRQCEAEARRRASSCATWKCECVSNMVSNTYDIIPVLHYFGRSEENSCVNHICGDQPGRCSDRGTCMAPQFHDYKHPSISLSDTIKFLGPGECVDKKRLPSSEELCSLTTTQLDQRIATAIKVGSSCELTRGVQGVCDQSGRCAPDSKADYYCKSSVNCTPCGSPGNMCWRGKCMTVAQASFQLCQQTHFFNSGRGICKQCFATFQLLKDGSCGTGVISSDPRGVNMDGASCWRDNGRLRGTCLDGQCLSRPTPEASPSPRASPGSSNRY